MRLNSVSRRRFLSGAAATGGAALLARPLQAAPAVNKPRARVGHWFLPKVAAKTVARPLPMADVRLLPSYWLDTMELDRSFLYSLPNDRLAYNFRVTAGLPTDAAPLGGWEAPDCELRGHYVGHYLSACALLHASTGDLAIRDKANLLVATLAQCQAKDGYLGAYPTELYDRLRAHQKVWAPFYTYHKIVAGMLDMYEHTGNPQALAVATRMMDWAIAWSAPISPDEWQKVLLTEHGGMNEAAFNLYAITGQPRYRDLAYRFEHKKIFEPLAANDDQLAGNHANTNIPKVIGAARGYQLTGDPRYQQISQNFYRFVTEHHAYCTGGTSNGEFWHAPDAIASQLGPAAEECCCSYNMMKLGRLLFEQKPDARYFDYYERLLMNVRYGTQDRNGMLMYYVSLTPGLYKTFGTPFNAFWCCTGTGSEEYAKLTDSIYFEDDAGLYVNLFLPSRLDWKARGLKLRLQTQLPQQDKVTLTVDAAPTTPTAIRLRIPYWATQGVSLKINGQPQSVPLAPSTYAVLKHPWAAGDTIELHLPMSLHLAPAPDDPSAQAAMYGPLVLAALMGTDGLTTSMIYADAGPGESERGMPMPQVNAPSPSAIWFAQVEGTREYPLRFKTSGDGLEHTLVPLNQVMDERYSVYLKNTAAKA